MKNLFHRTPFMLYILTLATIIALPFRIMASPLPIDLIVYNANITTQDDTHPHAQAIAIRNGKFFKVGSNDDVLALKSAHTKLLDAKGRRIIPGLNDSHLHVIRGGRFYNLELRWEGVPTLKQALSMLKQQAQRTPKGQWVRVIGGWSSYQFAEKRMPTLAEINEAAPHTPVFILFLYSKAMVNQAGLKALGITSKTKAAAGGRIELAADGQPSGLLLAEPSPTILYQTISLLPQLSAVDQTNSTRQFYHELNRFGLTSAIDAGGGGHVFPENYTGSTTLAKSGELPLRISYFLFPQKPGQELQSFKHWMEITFPGHNQHSQHEHGYEMEGGGEFLVWSAGDFENFLSPRPEQGKNMEAELERVTRLLLSKRWPFRIHATYNESITRILAVFEKINKDTPFNGLRWAIDHAETISRKNITRIKALGGGIAIQSRMAFAGEYFIERYGRQSAKSSPPLREMMNQGIPLGAGTDGTRVSSYNPWTALYWMVSGKTVGGTEQLDKHNRLSRAEALRLYTVGSAWFSAEENIKGRIAKGQYADFALLSDDYFKVPEEQIKSIESVLTVVNGKIVYGRGDFKALAPTLPTVTPAWSPVSVFGGHWSSHAHD